MARWKKTVYQKLARAARDGSGTYLTPAEVYSLAVMDDAVAKVCAHDDEAEAEFRRKLHSSDDSANDGPGNTGGK